MKSMLIAAALAAAALTGAAAVPAAANAQVVIDYGRPYYGPHAGPRWNSWRRGYYGRYHRNPARVCGPRGRCWYR